jgi:hypothetical protein
VLDSPESPAAAAGKIGAGATGYLTLLAALVVALGVVWNPLTRTADRAAASFRATTITPGK